METKKYRVVQGSRIVTETNTLEIARELLQVPALGSAVIIFNKPAIEEINRANKN